ncbi:MAG: hypothetical protein DRG11_07615 [Epsilonproteobacteria bacterium]|nr:MAG: hypothetical protein DRG11_07615 [Campylobacterota bacterium]
MIKLLLISAFVFSFIKAQDTNTTYTIGIVKVNNTTAKTKPNKSSKYDKIKLSKGQIVRIDKCNKIWCKLKGVDIYMLKSSLAIDEFADDPLANKKPNKPEKPVCIKLQKINIDDDSFKKSEIFDSLKGSCITPKLLQQIIKSITIGYMQDGFATTKPYLKPQDINDGNVDIGVIKGKVENIVHKETNDTSAKIFMAFVGQKDKQLDIRELETSLEMINRPTNTQAKFELKPGKQKGGTVVVINSNLSRWWHATLGVSGTNTKDKDTSLNGSLTIDNPLYINDIFKATINGSKIQKEYQGTKGYELDYSFAFGSYLISLIYSKNSYRQGVVGLNDTYLSKGDTVGKKLKVSKLLYRNQTNKLDISSSIYAKDTNNYFLNEKVEVSSYKTTLLHISLAHTWFRGFGTITNSITYHKGTNWFGARDDNYNSKEIDHDTIPKLQFQKWTFNSGLAYYFQDRSYRINSNFFIQYTDDYLYNNDQLTVGSWYSVRGYNDSNLYGNNGWYINNDIMKTFKLGSFPSVLQTISPYIGVDYGKTRCQWDNKDSCAEAYGGSIGFYTKGKYLNSSFKVARPFKKINKDDKQTNQFLYNITAIF